MRMRQSIGDKQVREKKRFVGPSSLSLYLPTDDRLAGGPTLRVLPRAILQATTVRNTSAPLAQRNHHLRYMYLWGLKIILYVKMRKNAESNIKKSLFCGAHCGMVCRT